MFFPQKTLRLLQTATIVMTFSRAIHAETQPLYRRISVTRGDDIDRLYPMVAAYVQDPSLAESVTELAFDSNHWRRSCYFQCDLGKGVTETEPTTPIRDEAHLALEKHIRALKLGQDTTTAMIRSLEWKKRQIIGAWDGPLDKKEDKNIEFGSTAIAILLSLCKNISTMYLGSLPYQSVIQDYMLKSNYKVIPEPGLQKLTKLEVISKGGGGYLEDERVYTDVEFLEVLQYIHRLPSIQSIHMEGVQEYQANRVQFVSRTGNMKKIHIGHADVSGFMLHKIISVPKALEELTVSLGGLWSTDGGLPPVSAFEIGVSLRQHQDTLKALDLDIDLALFSRWGQNGGMSGDGHSDEETWSEYDTWDEYNTIAYGEDYRRSDMAISVNSDLGKQTFSWKEYGGTVGSLHGFSGLTHLSISIKALMGVSNDGVPPYRLISQPPFRLIEALPPNLEYLKLYGYIRGTNADLDGHIDELLANRKDRLPKLKTVEGVGETIPDLGTLYPDGIQEEELWELPEQSLGWEEITAPQVDRVPEKDEL